MERAEWLKQMREKVEKLYDLYAPRYWTELGLQPNETHLEFLKKFLEKISPNGTVLSAACGAGRYDGILLEAGHSVVGIDQSAGMLSRAKEHIPEVRYEKISLQEMPFREEFDGVICVDALEHVFPEDWPGIMRGFRAALKPGGVLYFTVDRGRDRVEKAYERAKAMGLPVVFGEVADEVEEAYARAVTSGGKADAEDVAVYHFVPSLEQVREWIGQAGLVIEEEGTGEWYEHFIMRKK